MCLGAFAVVGNETRTVPCNMKDTVLRDYTMNIYQPARRRIGVLRRIFQNSCVITPNYTRATSNSFYLGEKVVTVGDVSKIVKPAKRPPYVPHKYVREGTSQNVLQHLRWMLQKDLLGQDMFLIGRPGPLRRQLAMQFLEITDRELEYISLSRDTTEADLKQRREIQHGTVIYFDQSAVRAATEGRILILDGIEKAERNVLPVLNNLLENREMQLEDGRFLISAKRYDKLLKEHGQEELDRWNLVRVSEDFRVIALGLPVPRYVGNSLDPPLRSRFQARNIDGLTYQEQLQYLRQISPQSDPEVLSQLLSCCHALLSKESSELGLPDFPAESLSAAALLLNSFPKMTTYDAIYRLYPYKSFLSREGQDAVENVFETFQVPKVRSKSSQKPLRIDEVAISENLANVQITSGNTQTDIKVPCGARMQHSSSKKFVPTAYQEDLLAQLVLSHKHTDMCVIGPKGCGKSSTVMQFAELLNYDVELIVLYQDMTSRDLVQQRETLPNGDTVWQNSQLVTAALEGKLAVLDGVHRLHPSTLAPIHRLVHDRELTLYNGRRLLHHERYEEIKKIHGLSDAQLEESGVLPIHPSFRIIGLAEPPTQGTSHAQWLSSEMLSLFLYHEMRPLKLEEEMHLVDRLYGRPGSNFQQVLKVAHSMRVSEDPAVRSIASSFSTRQLLRIAKRMAFYQGDSPASAIKRACLARFLPLLPQQVLNRVLSEEGLTVGGEDAPITTECRIDGDNVIIGQTKVPRYQTKSMTKVPDILFYDVPQHIQALEWLLQDFSLGEHLLLIGNQGVGKNKLVDRLLQLLNRPREYIQLHRDTTVQTLTIQPTVKNGIVVYEDSPLVQAVKLGHVLIVDEADKAPTHVTGILKALVESGEMVLSDGRRIVSSDNPLARDTAKNVVSVHPDFRMIVLANRPGFPFLGNDFFGALGDLFSCHAIDNPSADSEYSLLKQYGPDVPEKVIVRLVKAFGELRSMADQGLVQYPYSTREVVNIVRHLQEFPNESLVNVIRNVFDFDNYSMEVQELLQQTLQKHGIPVNVKINEINMAKEFPLPSLQLGAKWKVQHHDPPIPVPVEKRFFEFSPPEQLRQKSHNLDVTDTRGVKFSEMYSYVSVPLGDSAVVCGLGVGKSLENDPLKDWIYVFTNNPLKLFALQMSGKVVQEFPLPGISNQVKGIRPHLNVRPLKSGSNALLIHEESGNTLVVVDTSTGLMSKVPFITVMEKAVNNFAEILKINSKSEGWKLAHGLLENSNVVVLFENGGYRIELIDLDSKIAYTLSLPFTLKSLHLPTPDCWLIENEESKKYLLSKAEPAEPCPRLLFPIDESGNLTLLNSPAACGTSTLPPSALSQVLRNETASVGRIFTSQNCIAGVAVGFPDMKLSDYDLHVWPHNKKHTSRSSTEDIILESGQIVRHIKSNNIPDELLPNENYTSYLEVIDPLSHSIRYISIPQPKNVSSMTAWMYSGGGVPMFLAPTSNDGLATLDVGGGVRLWEIEMTNLKKSYIEWRQMIESGQEHAQITKERYSGLDAATPKHGKVDETGAPHVGGNTWAGGTGGRDTAGLGGKGGPYRLDAGHTVHQLSDEEKAAVPEHVKKAARAIAQQAFKKRLKEIQMSEYDSQLYDQFSQSVTRQVKAIRTILGSLQAKSKERQWLRHQTSGDLDDTKLIEGLTGEKNIYKKRAEKEPEVGSPPTKPKHLRLIVDVSGSMYRFNGYDGRLDREMEAVIMVMEAFQGFEKQILYDIVGHSGEDFNLVFVDHKKPPTDNKQRLDVIKTMHAHSQFCLSGDNTIAATKLGISSLKGEDCDEALVVVLSDANLNRYGISPESFAKVLTSEQKVSAYTIFIGSLGDEAMKLTRRMPAGRAYVCLDLKNIPEILRQIFAASVLNK